MSKLKELEKRLRNEPDNLGLRVMVAGALIDAGRRDDAVELYRSVAIAYRDHGRPQQAITVCRSILELAPDDAACRALLAALTGVAPEQAPEVAPVRRSSLDVTPLPAPLSYHDADPSSLSRPRLTRADLPPSLQQELAMIPEIEGIANAARQISASLLAAHQPEERDAEDDELLDADDEIDVTSADDALEAPRRARIDPHEALEHLGTLRPTVPLGRPRPVVADAADDDASDDELTFPPALAPIPRRGPSLDDDQTYPRPAPAGMRSSSLDVTEPRELPAGMRTLLEVTEPLELPLGLRSPRPRAEAPRLKPPSVAPRSEAAPPERPRLKPPSIAPPTQATGPLASALFAPVPPRNRAALLQRFRRRIAAIGTTVIRRGETGHGLVLVVRGQLDVHAERSDGARVSLDAIGAGDYVGEIGLVSRTPAAAYVVAATDSELLVLDAPEFYDVASAYPALWAAVSVVAERRTRDHARRLQA